MDQIDDISTTQVAIEAGLSPEEAFAAINIDRDNSHCSFQWDDACPDTTGTPWLMVALAIRINAASKPKQS